MSKKVNKKMEKPLYENKAVVPIYSNKVEVVISHDGLPVGFQFEANGHIDKMIELGFWKRV